MAASSGIDGKVVLNAATVLNITEWSLDVKHNVQDKTAFADTWEQKLNGLRGATGSFKGQFNADSSAGDLTGQKLLSDAALAGTSVALKLYYSTIGYYTIGVAFLSGMKVGNKVDGVCEIEFTFTVSGTVF